ncbi:hypothetical protein IB232_15835 [Pseudomonas sp. PDM15]|uniref:PilX N-terminal domain-containing pilus assembly protein n=1 Tax=Pseudomonas sp. PDM15 TaxID=2769303 RepID=UPI00177DB7F9|nr:PilX N-terminal domain-containing pilus assembly protein [Pseudomonas sp. PDM15]MBD9426805.1 hypothetical protein [Pseudomonas sp. PDM15]
MKNRDQKGMVLLVSLLLLLMLTLLAIAAANQSTLQLRIASNSELQNASFQVSESGIAHWTEEYFASKKFTTSDDDTLISSGRTDRTEEFTVAVVSAPSAENCGSSKNTIGLRPGGMQLYCFDIESTGKVCDASGTICTTAVHRQGGQKRGSAAQ